jgi:hypothetical protein
MFVLFDGFDRLWLVIRAAGKKVPQKHTAKKHWQLALSPQAFWAGWSLYGGRGYSALINNVPALWDEQAFNACIKDQRKAGFKDPQGCRSVPRRGAIC